MILSPSAWARPRSLDYLDLVNVTKVASGSISLPQSLVNMRCDYVFTYLSMNDGVGKSIASFTVKVKGGKDAPTQGHIAYSENHGDVWVTFVSGSPSVPLVKVGPTRGGEKPMVYKGTSTTYSAEDMCQSPANQTMQKWFRDPGMIHHVLLKGLKPSTQYFYQYGHEGTFSNERSFVTRASKMTYRQL